MNTIKPYILFSVYLNTLTESQNMFRHAQTLVELDDLNIGYRVLDGMFQGNKEKSILIQDIKIGIEFAKANDQESVLITDANGISYLHDIQNDTYSPSMVLKEVPKEVAEQNNAYTYDMIQDKYYILRNNWSDTNI